MADAIDGKRRAGITFATYYHGQQCRFITDAYQYHTPRLSPTPAFLLQCQECAYYETISIPCTIYHRYRCSLRIILADGALLLTTPPPADISPHRRRLRTADASVKKDAITSAAGRHMLIIVAGAMASTSRMTLEEKASPLHLLAPRFRVDDAHMQFPSRQLCPAPRRPAKVAAPSGLLFAISAERASGFEST